jgi:UDP-N-acetylglucosamine acyltransferase
VHDAAHRLTLAPAPGVANRSDASMASIHPTAIIEPGADLDTTVSVGAYSVVRAGVRVGAGTTIGAHCVIEGRTTIGRDNRIFQFCSLGAVPQDKKYAGEPTELHIGDRNTIREFCTFNLGTAQDTAVTRVGDDNWVMAYVHIAHDAQVGNQVTLANNATLAGHVHVGDWVTVGGLSGVHQFVKIGAHAFVGFSSAVTQDVPPYMMVDGNPLAVRGVNSEGLRRRGFDPERLAAVKQMHRLLYRSGLTFDESRDAIAALAGEAPHAAADIAMMSEFLSLATRGIAR